MTPKELAARLNGREYTREITREESDAAKEAGLVVLFGASDDLAEFRGAIHDEAGCYDGGTLHIVDGKLFSEPDCDCEWAEAAAKMAREHGRKIKAVWCGPNLPAWSYETDIPHETFDIMEDGEVYCRGIVFSLVDAAP